MATGEIVKPREIVKANNGLFRCKYKIKDVVACRIFMAFASLVDHNDIKENQSFVEYQIEATSIIQDINAGGGYYKQLRDAAYSLVDHKIEQHFERNNFAVYTLFSKIEYIDGIIKGEIHKDLMPFFLIAKEKFTRMRLSEYVKLPSIYSQLIFSFLKSWDDKKEIVVKISELHDMIDAPASIRKNYAEFKRRVLDKAQKDINEKTSLGFEFEAIKTGRAVSEIKFKFVKRRKISAPASPQASTFLQTALGVEPPDNAKYLAFDEFLRKFPNYGPHRWKAWKIWMVLQEKGLAPLAKDVQDKSTLSIIEFLQKWENDISSKLSGQISQN